MAKRTWVPLFWTLFSAGGVVAAFLIPIHILLFGLAFPLGWLQPPTYEKLLALAKLPLARLYLFVFCSLPLFHWAHRFRYTLHDGLQAKHLDKLIATGTYGCAIIGTLVAGYLLWSL